MYPENPEGTQVIVGSMNMGYISDTARNRTHNLFRPKQESIPLGHSDGLNSELTLEHFKTGLKTHLSHEVYAQQCSQRLCNLVKGRLKIVSYIYILHVMVSR